MLCMSNEMISAKVEETGLPGVLTICLPAYTDHRGVFEPTWDSDMFQTLGIAFRPESAAHSYNIAEGTIRAFHYQSDPFAQSKLVSCVSGRIWDVAVDLRRDSPGYLQWSAVELSAACGNSHFIPAGCAHGFLTLSDASTVAYLIEGPYRPEAAKTLRWNDPALGVPWPIEEPILSIKDRNAPLLGGPPQEISE